MKTIEFVLQVDRLSGQRLPPAERLLRWFGHAFSNALAGCDLAFSANDRTLVAFFRFRVDRFTPEDRQRLLFWAARSGARARALETLSGLEHATINKTLERCQVRFIGLASDAFGHAVSDLFTTAGADPWRPPYAGEAPSLAIDVDGLGWAAVRWNQDDETLFIASPTAPPLGDSVPVVLRARNSARPALEEARVALIRGPEEASPGRPAGFALSFEAAPVELRRELARCAPIAEFGTRSAPRFRLRAPIHAVMEVEAAEGLAASDRGRDDGLVGWVENLSLGGAFVRSETRPPQGTAIRLRFRLPTGVVFETRASVAFGDAHGVGVSFILEASGMNDLHDALTEVSARPRRALVVDDDALARQKTADALVARGFEVVTAADAGEGLHILAEELLSLDLLVTDLYLPGASGEDLVATIRRAGGESELVVVVMTGSPTPELATRLGLAGADLLVGKELGAELVALKADALLDVRLESNRARKGARSSGASTSSGG
jgi:CheY-like chemotaxis protein